MPNDTGFSARSPEIPVMDPDTVQAALAGLLATPKTLPPKLFYDREGCRLFYQITELPEYYLTRAEREPLRQATQFLSEHLQAGSTLVEYGASDETKALTLLRAAGPSGYPLFKTYVPIDVAGPSLLDLTARLATTIPDLNVLPIQADFTRDIVLPCDAIDRPALGFFPGSTIGNLEPDQAAAFLRRAHAALGPQGQFLLGADLRKDKSILLPAYDDHAGVTAAFNRNLLVRLNREACADFDPASFAHRAVWNDDESRIEMHLVSQRDQTVHLARHTIGFARGETIHTENSYKYTPERIRAIAATGGWRVHRLWTDPQGLFAVYLLGRG